MSIIKELKENVMPHNSLPKMVISSVAGWSTTYFLLKHVTRQEPEWTVRVITALQATVITLLAIIDWYYLQHLDYEILGEPNTEYEEAILCLTLGYFIFDLLWVIRYQTEGRAMYVHHISSIVCLIFILAKGVSATEVLYAISGLEMTNPCLQARWFLRTYGFQGTFTHILVEVVFMITFITLRLYYGSILIYNILKSPKCHFVLKLGSMSLYLVTWAFIYQMFFYVYKRYVKKSSDVDDPQSRLKEE